MAKRNPDDELLKMAAKGESEEDAGKHIFGVVKVGEKGQIVIPKKARDIFGIKPGDGMLILGDEKRGMAMVKVDFISDVINGVLGGD